MTAFSYHAVDAAGRQKRGVIEAGNAYHVGPGHTGEVADGTEILEFSPADLYKETVAVIMKNMEEMG